MLIRARTINRGYEQGFDLSFSSMLVGLLAGQSAWCGWLQRYVRDANVAAAEILYEAGRPRGEPHVAPFQAAGVVERFPRPSRAPPAGRALELERGARTGLPFRTPGPAGQRGALVARGQRRLDHQGLTRFSGLRARGHSFHDAPADGAAAHDRHPGALGWGQDLAHADDPEDAGPGRAGGRAHRRPLPPWDNCSAGSSSP